MLQRMSQEQLVEWFEYFTLEPFGQERADLRAGSIVAAVYNVNRKEGSKVLSARDCALVFSSTRKSAARVLTPEEKAKADRAAFDQFKMMVITVATQGKSR